MPTDIGSSSESRDIKKEAYRQVFYEIVESLIIDVCFKVHRGVKMGYFPVDEYIMSENNFHKTNANGKTDELLESKSNIDRKTQKKPQNVMCPRCLKPHGTEKLATHLYSCMKGGRQSRLSKIPPVYNDGDRDDGLIDDDEKDESFGQSSKKPKKKRQPAKKPKAKPIQKINANFVSTTVDLTSFEATTEMTTESSQDVYKPKSGAKPRRIGNTLNSSTYTNSLNFTSPVKMQPPENIFEDDNGRIDVDTISRDDDMFGGKRFTPRYYPEDRTSSSSTPDGNLHF